MFKVLVLIFAIFFVNQSFAAQASGKVTQLRYAIPDNIYFKLDPMPEGVTKWFYVRVGSGLKAGCEIKGHSESLQSVYTMLLAAKTSQQKITISYCQDTNSYGLVNHYIQLD